MNASQSDWWKIASATFAGGAVAIGLVAIPTYVWLPREFDEIRGKADEMSAEIKLASQSAVRAAELSSETNSEIASLVSAIAESDARSITLPLEADWGVYAADGRGSAESYEAFVKLLPFGMEEKLRNGKVLSKFRYSDFNGKEWIFISKEDFNKLDADTQEIVLSSFRRQGVEFRLLR